MKAIWHDNDNGVREADLQAYVDGLLEGPQRAAVEAYLATSPVEAERLAAYRRQNIALHALFDPMTGENLAQLPPAMARLAGELEAKLHRLSAPAPQSGDYRRLAACVALLVMGAAAWLVLDGGGWRDSAAEAYLPAALEAPNAPVIEGAGATPIKSSDTSPSNAAPTADPIVAPAIEKTPHLPESLPDPQQAPKNT